MTTTLRPRGREEHPEPGRRERAYDLCVNGRPAGSVRLSADERFGARTGRIQRLTVDPADRRRGRGTVAALASEELLRGWGCARVEVAVPAEAEGALELAAALGYSEARFSMVKRLAAAPPPLPPGSVPRPMTAEEYAVWRRRDHADLERRLARGGIPADRAGAKAAHAYRTHMPDGPDTAGMALRTLEHDGEAGAGWLWVRLNGAPHRAADAWVFLVEVAEDRRGRGHGRTLMLCAEHECAAAGVRALGLSVYADNAPARRLYDSLGYRVVERHLGKSLR